MVFECKRCGYCCTLRVKLGLFDILRIMKAGYKKRDFLEKDLAGKKVIKKIKGDCYFLERKGKKTKCRIYDYRPRICRIYPFLNKNIKSCNDLRKQAKFKNFN